MYSSSLLDSDTLDCFLLPQLIGSPTSEDIACSRLAVTRSLAQSASEYPQKSILHRLEAYATQLGALQIDKDALHRGPMRGLHFFIKCETYMTAKAMDG